MAVVPPKIVKEIQKDIATTITELRKNHLLRDETGITITPQVGSAWNISYATRNNAGSIIYDNNITYSKLIDELLYNRQYTILLYDMSLIQAEFYVRGNRIEKERLLFIKKHNVMWNRDEINEWEVNDDPWFENENGIPVVFRVDYDPYNYEDIVHPNTHFTLSNYESCRIPMKGIVTFSEFVAFVLKNFYEMEIKNSQFRYMEETISVNEKKLIHLNWE